MTVGIRKVENEFLNETFSKAYTYNYAEGEIEVLLYSKKDEPEVFRVDSLDKVKSRHVTVAIYSILDAGYEKQIILKDDRFDPEVTLTFRPYHSLPSIFKKFEMLEANLLGNK